METAAFLHALLLGAVEGLTEFLPVSSTGHLIILSHFLGLTEEKDKAFSISIQLGAILAVVWEYRARFARVATGLGTDPVQRRFVANLAVAFMPAAVTGLLLHSRIKAHLFNPVTVAAALVAGAIVIFAVERWYRAREPRVRSVDEMTWQDALKVGLAQCFALIPGTSRSGATIMGGLAFGLSREAATQFSFFLAVPIMVAATGHQLFKYREVFRGEDWAALGVGFVAAFFAALVAVKTFTRYVARHDFRPFAWYRIALGVAVLAYFGAFG